MQKNFKRSKKSKWGHPNEKFIASNISNIIPPNLSPDLKHAALLRIRFEEIQYKLEHLYDEFSNVLFEEKTYDRYQSTPEIRARESLFNEMSQLIEEIVQFYPAFMLPYSRFSLNKPTRRVTLPNHQSISLLMGPKCTNLTKFEHNYQVSINLRIDAPKGDGETESYAIVTGNNQEEVDRCADSINQLLQGLNTQISDNGSSHNQAQENLELQNTPESKHHKNYQLSFDPSEELYPWSSLGNHEKLHGKTNDEIEQEVNDLINDIDIMHSELEEENVLTLEELKRFTVDIIDKDISSILIPPQPPE